MGKKRAGKKHDTDDGKVVDMKSKDESKEEEDEVKMAADRSSELGKAYNPLPSSEQKKEDFIKEELENNGVTYDDLVKTGYLTTVKYSDAFPDWFKSEISDKGKGEAEADEGTTKIAVAASEESVHAASPPDKEEEMPDGELIQALKDGTEDVIGGEDTAVASEPDVPKVSQAEGSSNNMKLHTFKPGWQLETSTLGSLTTTTGFMNADLHPQLYEVENPRYYWYNDFLQQYIVLGRYVNPETMRDQNNVEVVKDGQGAYPVNGLASWSKAENTSAVIQTDTINEPRRGMHVVRGTWQPTEGRYDSLAAEEMTKVGRLEGIGPYGEFDPNAFNVQELTEDYGPAFGDATKLSPLYDNKGLSEFEKIKKAKNIYNRLSYPVLMDNVRHQLLGQAFQGMLSCFMTKADLVKAYGYRVAGRFGFKIDLAELREGSKIRVARVKRGSMPKFARITDIEERLFKSLDEVQKLGYTDKVCCPGDLDNWRKFVPFMDSLLDSKVLGEHIRERSLAMARETIPGYAARNADIQYNKGKRMDRSAEAASNLWTASGAASFANIASVVFAGGYGQRFRVDDDPTAEGMVARPISSFAMLLLARAKSFEDVSRRKLILWAISPFVDHLQESLAGLVETGRREEFKRQFNLTSQTPVNRATALNAYDLIREIMTDPKYAPTYLPGGEGVVMESILLGDQEVAGDMIDRKRNPKTSELLNANTFVDVSEYDPRQNLQQYGMVKTSQVRQQAADYAARHFTHAIRKYINLLSGVTITNDIFKPVSSYLSSAVKDLGSASLAAMAISLDIVKASERIGVYPMGSKSTGVNVYMPVDATVVGPDGVTYPSSEQPTVMKSEVDITVVPLHGAFAFILYGLEISEDAFSSFEQEPHDMLDPNNLPTFERMLELEIRVSNEVIRYFRFDAGANCLGEKPPTHRDVRYLFEDRLDEMVDVAIRLGSAWIEGFGVGESRDRIEYIIKKQQEIERNPLHDLYYLRAERKITDFGTRTGNMRLDVGHVHGNIDGQSTNPPFSGKSLKPERTRILYGIDGCGDALNNEIFALYMDRARFADKPNNGLNCGNYDNNLTRPIPFYNYARGFIVSQTMARNINRFGLTTITGTTVRAPVMVSDDIPKGVVENGFGTLIERQPESQVLRTPQVSKQSFSAVRLISKAETHAIAYTEPYSGKDASGIMRSGLRAVGSETKEFAAEGSVIPLETPGSNSPDDRVWPSTCKYAVRDRFPSGGFTSFGIVTRDGAVTTTGVPIIAHLPAQGAPINNTIFGCLEELVVGNPATTPESLQREQAQIHISSTFDEDAIKMRLESVRSQNMELTDVSTIIYRTINGRAWWPQSVSDLRDFLSAQYVSNSWRYGEGLNYFNQFPKKTDWDARNGQMVSQFLDADVCTAMYEHAIKRERQLNREAQSTYVKCHVRVRYKEVTETASYERIQGPSVKIDTKSNTDLKPGSKPMALKDSALHELAQPYKDLSLPLKLIAGGELTIPWMRVTLGISPMVSTYSTPALTDTDFLGNRIPYDHWQRKHNFIQPVLAVPNIGTSCPSLSDIGPQINFSLLRASTSSTYSEGLTVLDTSNFGLNVETNLTISAPSFVNPGAPRRYLRKQLLLLDYFSCAPLCTLTEHYVSALEELTFLPIERKIMGER
jgi:hypothetical protein